MRFQPGVIAGAAMTATMVLGAFAVAQPRTGRPPPHAPPRPAPPEKRPPAPPPSASAEPPLADGAASILSAPTTPTAPTTPASSGDGAGRLSALNPVPNELPDAAPSPPSADYVTLLSEVASLRSRVAAVSDALFHSRIAISLETSADHARVAGLSVWLDGGVVWTTPSPIAAREAVTVYDHAVAPGHHDVAVEVEYLEDGEVFRSSQRSRFLVEVPADERLVVEIRAWDDSSMKASPRDRKGEYDLRIRARQSAQPLGR